MLFHSRRNSPGRNARRMFAMAKFISEVHSLRQVMRTPVEVHGIWLSPQLEHFHSYQNLGGSLWLSSTASSYGKRLTFFQNMSFLLKENDSNLIKKCHFFKKWATSESSTSSPSVRITCSTFCCGCLSLFLMVTCTARYIKVQQGSISIRCHASNGVPLDSSLGALLTQLLDSVKRVPLNMLEDSRASTSVIVPTAF